MVKKITEEIMKTKIPTPAIERLCSLYHILEQLETKGNEAVSSKELGELTGVGAHNIRKDINYLGEIGSFKAGYEVKKLKAHLSGKLGLDKKKKACIVGLGRLGNAILNYDRLLGSGFEIVAGFDSNINKVETLQTSVPLFPAHEIPEVVKSMRIDLAVIAVPAQATAETARRLINGGIRGIVNFSPAVIKPAAGVAIRNIDLVAEFRILTVESFLFQNH
jgi:redox-sensing transcriptional repressor